MGKIAMGCVLNASTVIIKLFLSIHAPSPNASSMMFSRDKALNIFFSKSYPAAQYCYPNWHISKNLRSNSSAGHLFETGTLILHVEKIVYFA